MAAFARMTHVTTENVKNDTSSLGTASTPLMAASFPSSPIHQGQYAPDSLQALAEELLKTGALPQAGGYYSLAGFSRDFNENGPPAAGDVETGGGGLPGNAYGPNPASPNNPGSINPTDVPAPPTEGYPPASEGNGSRAFPDNTSEAISLQTIGALGLGQSFDGSSAAG